MNWAISVSGLTKAYGDRVALNGLNLSVRAGTVLGLLGANGAGKSTAIECMLGTRRADSGTVRLLGVDPLRQRRSLFEQVGVQLQESGYQTEIRVDELCQNTACIGDQLKRAVKSLSGGERQRLFIVLALIPRPKLVFLDELTTGLDARARREVWRILTRLKARGLTILLTSHFMDEVEALCDEICILKRGETVFQGTVEQARQRCGCEKFEDAYLMLSEGEVMA